MEIVEKYQIFELVEFHHGNQIKVELKGFEPKYDWYSKDTFYTEEECKVQILENGNPDAKYIIQKIYALDEN